MLANSFSKSEHETIEDRVNIRRHAKTIFKREKGWCLKFNPQLVPFPFKKIHFNIIFLPTPRSGTGCFTSRSR